MIDRYAIEASTPGGVTLAVKALTTTLADTWSPYIQGTLTTALPAAGVVTALDPRQALAPIVRVVVRREFGDDGNRLSRWTEQAKVAGKVKVSKLTALGANKVKHFTGLAVHYNGAPVSGQELRLALPVDDLSTDERAGTMALDVGGLELRMQDAANVDTISLAGGSIRDHANDLIIRSGIPGHVLTGGTEYRVDQVWEQGETAWDAMERIVGDAPVRLIYDEQGMWRVISRDNTDPSPAVTLAGLTELSRSLARKDWHDSVAVIWTWEAPNPFVPGELIPFRFVEYAKAAGWSRPLIVEKNEQYPGPYLAQYLADRELRKGEQHSYSGPANLTVRPLQAVTITDSTGTRDATVTRVQWAFPAATMTIDTREA